jgi:hypothetical protein
VLGLDSLKWNPRDEKSQLQLVCTDEVARVALTFSGSPEVKLSEMSAQGLK